MSLIARVLTLLTTAALVSTSAALSTSAQKKVTPRTAEQSTPKKVSTRPEEGNKPAAPSPTNNAPAKPKEDSDATRYVYEFEQPDFFVYFIHIEHDDSGRGLIRFERRSDTEQITDPFELSPAAMWRIRSRLAALKFLDSTENYQGERTYPNQGKTRFTMRQAGRERTAEFNYSQNANAQALADEYRRASEQTLFVFDIKIALESQPLETPKLINRLESLLSRNYLSDKQQLAPLLRQLSEDERVPLVGRNQAARLLKKLEKLEKEAQ